MLTIQRINSKLCLVVSLDEIASVLLKTALALLILTCIVMLAYGMYVTPDTPYYTH